MPDVVEQYTPFGYFSSSGGEGGYTPVAKRAILFYFARQFGTESPEYASAAKRWPKQARKVLNELNAAGGAVGLPGTGRRAADNPLVPVASAYDPFRTARGIDVVSGVNPPTRSFFDFSLNALLAAYGLGELRAIFTAPKLLSAFLKRRFAKESIGKVAQKAMNELGKMTADERNAAARSIDRRQLLARVAKYNKESAAKSKLSGPSAVKTAEAVKQTVSRKRRLAEAILAGGAAGTAAQIVSEIIARTAHPTGGQSSSAAQPGSGAASSSDPGRNTPPAPRTPTATGSHTSSTPAAPGQESPRGSASSSSSSTTTTATKPKHVTAPLSEDKTVAQLLFGLLQTNQSGVVSFLTDLAKLHNQPRSGGGRDPVFTPEPTPEPLPQPLPLTGFSGGGVRSPGCECGPKKPRSGKRKRRTVCYTGRFSETATGTIKFDKRKRTTCLPSRKRPASARAS